MSVSVAQERPDSPEASFEMGKHIIIRRFIVFASSVNDGPIEVATAVGIPWMFTPYYYGAEFHPFCLVRSVVPRRIRPGSTQWEVEVRYETPDPKDPGSHAGGGPGTSRGEGHGGGGDGKMGTGVDTQGEYQNPVLELPELETHFETRQVPIYQVQGTGFSCTLTFGSDTFTIGANNPWIQVGDPCTLSNPTPLINMAYGGIIQDFGKSVSTFVLSYDPITGIVTTADIWPYATTKGIFTDNQVRPPQASTNEPFNPPPMMDESKLILTISRNEPLTVPHPAVAVAYQDAVNSDTFWGCGPGTVRCANITVRREVRQVVGGTYIAFLRTSYTFHIKKTHDVQVLDKGTFYWNKPTSQLNEGVTPVKQAFTTDDGQVLNEGPLDGTGQKLANGAPFVWLYYRPYSWKPFSYLNLPQSFAQVQ